jgi:hypothetical protein
MVPYGRRVADDLSVRYGDLLTGSYDCADRIVLNAFFPSGCSPGGFRTWWRALHGGSDEHLDDTRLMRMAGRFGRRVRAWGQSAGVPVIYCKAGERKHLIAGRHLAGHEVGTGVFLVLAAKAMAPVWKVKRPASGVITNLERKVELVNHYSFQCATRRLVVSLTQLGGIWRIIPGSDGLPGSER